VEWPGRAISRWHAHHFPGLLRSAGVFQRAKNSIGSFAGVVIMIPAVVIVGRFFTETLADGLIALVGALLLAFVYHWLRFPSTARKWETQFIPGSSAAKLIIRRRSDASPDSLDGSGVVTCKIETPIGEIRSLEVTNLRSEAFALFTDDWTATPGMYCVWWYGSRGRWRREITHGWFLLTVDGAQTGKLLTGVYRRRGLRGYVS
jgi:hypothetical protein